MKLIVQGAFLSPSDIDILSRLSHASGVEHTGKNVWRFNDVKGSNTTAIQEHCLQLRADAAFLESTVSLLDYKLVAMDMDCTFIQIECIDEIAGLYGVKEQVSAITHAAMNGELDFNESLAKRVALLKGMDESTLQKVFDEKLRLSPGAVEMLDVLQQAGIKTLLVSGGFTFFAEKLKNQYKLDYTRANVLDIVDGKLTGKIIGTIVNAEEKAKTLLGCCEELGISPAATIAIGDGANDLKMLHSAGLSIAYHAKPKVKQQANLAFDYVGLDGVVNLFK
ncbi:MAG: phosphoserine phosphatase SerB [Chitinophagaceae bacterium]